jgi:hypothetical protein
MVETLATRKKPGSAYVSGVSNCVSLQGNGLPPFGGSVAKRGQADLVGLDGESELLGTVPGATLRGRDYHSVRALVFAVLA